jgi:hypothetical protein
MTPVSHRPRVLHHPTWVGLALLALLPALSVAGENPDPILYALDQQIRLSRPQLPGLDGGPPRPVGVMVRPDGTRDEFVLNEVILRPTSEEDLQAFLTTYGGTVLRDGTPMRIAGAKAPPVPAEPSGWYLIRVDVQRSSLQDLAPKALRSPGAPTSTVRWAPAGRWRPRCPRACTR